MKYEVKFIIDTDLDKKTLEGILVNKMEKLGYSVSDVEMEDIGVEFYFEDDVDDLFAIAIPEDATDVRWDLMHQDHYPHSYRLCIEYSIDDGGAFLTTIPFAYSSDFAVHGLDIEKVMMRLVCKKFNTLEIPGKKFVIFKKTSLTYF